MYLPFHRLGYLIGFDKSQKYRVKRGESEGGEYYDDEPRVPESLGENEIIFLGATDVAVDVPHRNRDQSGQPEREIS